MTETKAIQSFTKMADDNGISVNSLAENLNVGAGNWVSGFQDRFKEPTIENMREQLDLAAYDLDVSDDELWAAVLFFVMEHCYYRPVDQERIRGWISGNI